MICVPLYRIWINPTFINGVYYSDSPLSSFAWKAGIPNNKILAPPLPPGQIFLLRPSPPYLPQTGGDEPSPSAPASARPRGAGALPSLRRLLRGGERGRGGCAPPAPLRQLLRGNEHGGGERGERGRDGGAAPAPLRRQLRGGERALGQRRERRRG